MEIVLQWFDELDDLVFTGFLLWERIRRYCLWIGLIAALSVHAANSWNFSTVHVMALLGLSITCLVLWWILSMIAALLDHRANRSLGQA